MSSDAVCDPFWLDYPHILWEGDRLREFWPTIDMTGIEKLNALMRLSIYIGIILMIYVRAFWPMYIVFIVSLLTIFMRNSPGIKKEESMIQIRGGKIVPKRRKMPVSDKPCRPPTIQNPFMNPLVTDFDVPQYYEKACPNTANVRHKENEDYYSRMFMDVGDIYGKTNGERQFYTVPGNSIPNDQNAFARWLYRSEPGTCKAGFQELCTGFESGGPS